MDRVFFVFRHGETDWNKEKRCQGHTNTSLNELGKSQATELALKLSSFPIEIIYSSDLMRAYETGEAVANCLKIPIWADERLREMSYGEAEGMTVPEIKLKYGDPFWQKLHSFKKEYEDIGFQNGETRRVARLRIEKLLNEIIKNTQYKYIGISTHGGALRNILHHFLPEDQEVLAIPNCVVYRMEYIAGANTFIVNPTPIV